MLSSKLHVFKMSLVPHLRKPPLKSKTRRNRSVWNVLGFLADMGSSEIGGCGNNGGDNGGDSGGDSNGNGGGDGGSQK